MAARWNSEFYVAMEQRDLQASAMAVNNSGNFVLLAGRRCIAIKNLDDIDGEPLKKFPRQSKYEVGSAEWNPTEHNRELCVISSNQRLEVLCWSKGELTQSHSLRAHTRVITGLNWHRSDPNILASCSVDTFIYIWDIRDSRRPSISLSAIAEATQVRWNTMNSNILATAHDGDVKLWDRRKGTAPVQYISAHLSKIHGLDWSPRSETYLATSGQDCTVKFFDTTNARRAESVLTTNAPVWRARFTPFGNGLVTVVVPQLRRGENGLLLWNTDNRGSPVHTFVGHRDVVLDFDWRKRLPNDVDFELITWSKDQTLLIWKIDPFVQKLCGHRPEENAEEDLMEELVKTSSPKIQLLQQEFSLLNVHIPNMEVVKMDVTRRTCTVKVDSSLGIVCLQVIFPNAYPHGVPPTFQIVQGSTIDAHLASQLTQTLNHVAQQRVIKNRTCLEPCLRQLVATIEQYQSDPTDSKKQFDVNYTESSNLGTYNDTYIPFPRTSGAKFCSANILVCFGRSINIRKAAINKGETATPRALSALGNYGSKRSNGPVTISSYYYQKSRRTQQNPYKGPKAYVLVYDVSPLFYVNRFLADNYILAGDVVAICRYNKSIASSIGRVDLVQAWTLAELVSGPQQAEEDMCWTYHPFGNELMQSLISHYANQSDVQTAAMLCCIFGKENETNSKKITTKQRLIHPESGGSPYHTIPVADIITEGIGFPLIKSTRSSSLENLRLHELQHPSIVDKDQNVNLYEYYKLSYAELLHRWKLLYNRVEVLKYMSTPSETYRGLEFLTDCQNCQKPSKYCTCDNCKKLSLNCIICHTSVRGSANCCLMCGHGGHTAHMQQWFVKNKMCPSGCGCRCLAETAEVFKL
ncbi:GATOR2 complex protein WDR59 isoform X2 [Onthophagus taurus]|uniref:GATOR2 complex protein WDR59 isoform X2 n=1 Tax=Onthophagus taurus TaxID=166361 RepID=UPI000C20D5CC|nr:GATOR complex protein WDR59 isoform X2 [Onthophagus taurus]